MRSKLTILGLVGLLLAGAGALHAQEAKGPMPVFEAKRGKVTEAINTKLGAVFDLGHGVTMTFPKGLPVGQSRLVTLQKGRGLPGKLIHKKWKPLGKALDFNGAFSTSGKPIILAMPMKRDPVKRGMRLVVAMEIGTFCEGPNKKYKLKGGLCSGFELHDAEYDAASKRMVAELESTGGLRMQFGLVPEDTGDED
ncbi:MAG: hypothetical protein PVI30_05425 [Myxococcales bacterium]|jgi:hypothetical protein